MKILILISMIRKLVLYYNRYIVNSRWMDPYNR
nr:MAG TPA: hypothetical protein [Caudoviricetes sp.]